MESNGYLVSAFVGFCAITVSTIGITVKMNKATRSKVVYKDTFNLSQEATRQRIEAAEASINQRIDDFQNHICQQIKLVIKLVNGGKSE